MERPHSTSIRGRSVVAGMALATLLFAGAACAQPVGYTWTGYGINVSGSSKCPTFHFKDTGYAPTSTISCAKCDEVVFPYFNR